MSAIAPGSIWQQLFAGRCVAWLMISVCPAADAPNNVTQAAEPPITALVLSPDGSQVVAGSQAGLRILSWPDLRPVRTLDTDQPQIHDLVFSPNGRLLAAAGGAPAEFGTVEVYDWLSGKVVYRDESHEDVVYALGWNADGARCASASLDRSLKLHHLESAAVEHTLVGHSRGVLAVEYLPGGRQLVSAGLDQSLRVWDIGPSPVDKQSPAAGESPIIPSRILCNHTQAVHDLCLRPGGDADALPVFASASADRTIRFWQPTIGRMMRFARLDSSAPLAIVWTSDGNWLIAACDDGAVRRFDPDTVEMAATRQAVTGPAYSLALHPDGRLLVGGRQGQLQRVEGLIPSAIREHGSIAPSNGRRPVP